MNQEPGSVNDLGVVLPHLGSVALHEHNQRLLPRKLKIFTTYQIRNFSNNNKHLTAKSRIKTNREREQTLNRKTTEKN